MALSARSLQRLVLVALCFLGVSLTPFVRPASAELSGKEWATLTATHKELFSAPGQLDEKKAVLEQVLAQGAHPKALKLLGQALLMECTVWWKVHKELGEVTGKYSERMVEITNYTEEEEAELKGLKAEVDRVEKVAETERAALVAVIDAILAGPEALRKNILKRAASGDWAYRAAAIRIALRTYEESESKTFVNRMMLKEKDHRVRSVAMDALARLEKGWEPLVIGRLADPVWGIQVQAIRIIEERKHMPAVPHLINAFSKASIRVQEVLGAALRTLTGENFEADAGVWVRWWEDNKDDFDGNPKMAKMRPKAEQDVDFYGLRIKSDRILFIVDVSKSMEQKVENENPAEKWKKPPTITGPGEAPPPPPPEEILSGPKIRVARHELKKAIKQLSKDTTFNIIAFNHLAKLWKPEMVKATEANKKDAYKWMRALKPRGNTYTDGALRVAFQLAGLETWDKAQPDVYVDTIVLLSDGVPTTNAFNSERMDPEIVLQHVREWNKNKQVVIHCVGVDMVDRGKFLVTLAAENGGSYVDR